MSLTIDDARAVFARRVAAWLAADVDAYLECWHTDMALTLPGGRVVAGVDAYRRLLEASFAWATPVSFDVHALAVDGDLVLSDWTIRARRCDDGVEVEWRGLSVCELRDDRIVWWREHHLRSARTRRLTRGARYAVSCAASGASTACGVASTSSRKRSTASLKAFGASAMRPCAAPLST